MLCRTYVARRRLRRGDRRAAIFLTTGPAYFGPSVHVDSVSRNAAEPRAVSPSARRSPRSLSNRSRVQGLNLLADATRRVPVDSHRRIVRSSSLRIREQPSTLWRIFDALSSRAAGGSGLGSYNTSERNEDRSPPTAGQRLASLLPLTSNCSRYRARSLARCSDCSVRLARHCLAQGCTT